MTVGEARAGHQPPGAEQNGQLTHRGNGRRHRKRQLELRGNSCLSCRGLGADCRSAPLSTRVPIRSLGHRPFVRIASPRRMDADRYAAPPFPRTARAGAFGCSRPRRARRAPLARRDVRTIAARSDRAMRRSPALCCPGRGHLIAAREERGAVAPLLGRARVTR